MNFVTLGELLTPARTIRAGDGTYPLLSMTMHQGLMDQSARFKKRIASNDTATYKVVHRGQLVVGFPIDEGVLDFQTLHDAAIVSPAYEVWDVDTIGVSRPYLRRFLKSPAALGFYKAKLQGSTARRRSLPRADFLALRVPLPRLDEQRRIAAILDQADTLRAKRRDQLALLDALPQAIFHEMFSGEPPTSTLGDVASIQGGLQVSAARDEFLSRAPYLRVANCYRGFLDLSEVKSIGVTERELLRTTLRAGDLLFVEGHANPSEVGRVAVWESQIPNCVHQNHLIRARLDTNLIRPKFAMHWFNSWRGRQSITCRANTTSGLNTISASVLRSASIPIPPMDHQLIFERTISRIPSRKMAASDAALDDLFASLQSRAFSGEL